MHDDDGRVAYAINIFRDITDAQRAEERQHAALALEYVADGVFLLDTDDVVRFWNPAAEAITGPAVRSRRGQERRGRDSRLE